MGLLVDGQWRDQWYDTKASGGRFVRKDSAFRHWVRRNGSTSFLPDADRYHLYVSYACPWAHRTLIVRALKGLQHVIGVTGVDPLMKESGWVFTEQSGGEPWYDLQTLWSLYVRADPTYTGRVTVPVLWDRVGETIVNNESSEIIRMLNEEFNEHATDPDLDLYPEALRSQIDEWNALIYPGLNNGVYRAGFATTQAAYDAACADVFATLDTLEAHLAQHRYLCGDGFTEADIRLFTTLYRFDSVYHGHFKCNRRQVQQYPHLWNYSRSIFQLPGVPETCRPDEIVAHYYGSHPTINPTGVIPVGPDIDWDDPASLAR